MSARRRLDGHATHGSRASGPADRMPDALTESMDVAGELLARVMHGDLDDATDLVCAIQATGISVETILFDVIEPASARLRELWQDDRCDDLSITYALGRMQTLVRHLGIACPQPLVAPTDRRSILLATAPGETHMLSLALTSECFWRAGWDVTCEFPASDAELNRMLRAKRFDALEVSLSSVFRRDHRLTALAATLRSARLASANQSIVMLVSGHAFVERAEFVGQVGADAAYAGASRAVALADLLVSSAPSAAATSFASVRRELFDIGERVAKKAFRDDALARGR